MNVIRLSFTLLLIALLARWGYQQGTAGQPDALLPQASSRQFSVNNPLQKFAGQPVNTSRFTINGLPAEVEAFHSDQSPDELMKDYRDEWRQRGLAGHEQTLAGMQIASVLNEAENQLETVILMPAGGKTMVVPANLDLGAEVRQSNPKTPVFPGATQIYHIESDDAAGYSENLILSSRSNASTVLNFYRSRFVAEGWKMQDPGGGLPVSEFSQSQFFRRGADERWVIAEQPPGNAETMVFLLYQDK